MLIVADTKTLIPSFPTFIGKQHVEATRRLQRDERSIMNLFRRPSLTKSENRILEYFMAVLEQLLGRF